MQWHFHFWKHDFTIICSPMLNLQGVIILSIKIKRMVIVSWATKYISMRKMINRIYFRIYTTQINTNHLPHCTIQVNSYSSIICEREKKTTTNTTGFKMGWLYNSIILKFSKVILWTLILILHFVSSKIFHQWKANRCTIYNFMVI